MPLAQTWYGSSLSLLSNSLQGEREREPWKLVTHSQLAFKQSSKMMKSKHRKKQHGFHHFPQDNYLVKLRYTSH